MDQNLVEYLKRLHEKFSQLKMIVAKLKQQQVVHAGKEQKIQEKFQGLMDIPQSREVKIDDHKKSVRNHIMAVENNIFETANRVGKGALEKRKLSQLMDKMVWTKWLLERLLW